MTHVRAQHGISGNVNGGGGFLFFDARITSASIPEPWSYILFRQNNNANRDNKKQPTNNLYTNATQYYSTCIYTHTLSVKATAAAVIVCVKPAAYQLLLLPALYWLSFFFVPSLLQLSNSIPLCFFCLDKWTPTRPHLLTPTYGVCKAPLLGCLQRIGKNTITK